MTHTRKPLVAVSGFGAFEMRAGGMYDTGKKPRGRYQSGGSVTSEVPFETLMQLEPLLVEIHLTTLSKKDKEVFMEKYRPLNDDMRRAALIQMIGKYPEVMGAIEQQGGSYQMGGTLPDYPSLRGTYDQPVETSYVRPKPLVAPNYNMQFLDFATPASREAQALSGQGRYDEAQVLRDQIMAANTNRQQMEQSGPLPRLYKKGGLTKTKAAEMLHDGKVHGKPITDKQRRYFAAVANKQSGGEVDQWEYVAPPTEGGWVFSGITSNRPVKGNTTDISKNPQGRVSSSKSHTTSASKTSAQTKAPVSQGTAPQPRPALQSAPLYQQTSPFSAPQVYAPQVSNTTRAIAGTTGDPIYSLATTSMGPGRTRAVGITPTPWYMLDMGKPNKEMGRNTTLTAYGAVGNFQSGTKRKNNPLSPPREVTDRFLFISNDRKTGFENVYDPITNTEYTRDPQTGRYYEGYSENPDRSFQEAMDMRNFFSR